MALIYLRCRTIRKSRRIRIQDHNVYVSKRQSNASLAKYQRVSYASRVNLDNKCNFSFSFSERWTSWRTLACIRSRIQERGSTWGIPVTRDCGLTLFRNGLFNPPIWGSCFCGCILYRCYESPYQLKTRVGLIDSKSPLSIGFSNYEGGDLSEVGYRVRQV